MVGVPVTFYLSQPKIHPSGSLDAIATLLNANPLSSNTPRLSQRGREARIGMWNASQLVEPAFKIIGWKDGRPLRHQLGRLGSRCVY